MYQALNQRKKRTIYSEQGNHQDKSTSQTTCADGWSPECGQTIISSHQRQLQTGWEGEQTAPHTQVGNQLPSKGWTMGQDSQDEEERGLAMPHGGLADHHKVQPTAPSWL
jgi:hypothetical protein